MTTNEEVTWGVDTGGLLALFDERDQLRADLLATRRALKMAQAKALRLHAKFLVYGDWGQIRPGKTSWWSECYGREIDRGARLLNHYAAKFEREAKEMGK